jgi:hypothetical protein
MEVIIKHYVTNLRTYQIYLCLMSPPMVNKKMAQEKNKNMCKNKQKSVYL